MRYGELAPNLSVPIQFTIRNMGLSSLENPAVSLSGGASASYAGTLLPNETVTLTLYHQVGDTVENTAYTVQTDNGTSLSGTVYLDYPDIGISQLEVLEESNGLRTIAVTLYNASGATLTGKGREVKLELYLDELHTLPASVSLAPQAGVSLSGNTLTISGDEALQRVDQGSMTLILTYDLGSYVQGTLGLQEIPDSGVMLYADAWAEGRVGSQTEIIRLPEYANSNNQASLQMTGALSRMNGQQVTQNVEQGADAGGNTTVDVILKNNGLQPAKVEKLLAALFHGEGYLLELKEVDTSSMTLDGETVETIPVSFSKQGSHVAVYPADSRDTLIFDGLPVRMGSFTYDEESGTYQYTLSDVTVRGSLVTAYSAGSEAVTINNKELPSGGSQWVQFTALTNKITVTLGGNTYVLTVNMDPSMVSDAEYPNIPKDPVGATYELNQTAEALVVEAESPDGGTLSYQWYGEIPGVTGGPVPIPEATESSFDPTMYEATTAYYYCVVTNTNLSVTGIKTATATSRTAVVVYTDGTSPVDAQMPVIDTQPADAAYTVGDQAAELTVEASVNDGGTLSYQWFRSDKPGGTGGTEIPGATSAAYTPATDQAGTVYYYCLVTNTNDAATGLKTAESTTRAAKVTVTEETPLVDAQTPVIDTQPADAAYTVGGQAAELTVEASVNDGGTLSYQWFRSDKPGGTGGTEIPGATSAAYTPSTDQAGTVYYYCLVTNTNDAATGQKTAESTTRAAKVTVTEPETPEYTISFDANGGSVEPATAVTTDGKLSTLPQPTRSNYTFDGWYTEREGGDRITENTVFQSNTIIYAHWIYTGSSGGGGTSTYRITVEASINGTVKSNRTSASGGSIVTLTATPDSGYQLNTLTVTNSSGKELKLTKKETGVYTFTMPYGSVTVRATFTASDSVSQCLHSTSCPAYRFTDLDLNAWYHDGIHYYVEQGQMNGVSGDTFQPEGTTTRGMIVTILYRMEGEPTVTGTSKFNDVPADQWYTDAVVWAADNDIVTGYGGGRFGPDDPITREQMAVILFRYAQYKGHDVSIGEDTNILSYVDATEIGEYAIPAMQWACGSDLINGVSGNALNPKDTASRAETATLLMRFAQKIIK